MRGLLVLIAVAMGGLGHGACAATPDRATPDHATLQRIRADGVLRCGSVIRPGLAFPGADGIWRGLNVEICRAVAVAVLGPGARTEFHSYASDKDFGRVRRGDDELAFLTMSELAGNDLTGAVLPGPPVFYLSDGIMVWDTSPARHVADLAGVMVCAEPGTGPERTLAGYFRAHRLALNFSGWQEAEEMMDAFDVGRCPAIAQEVTALAALRLTSEAEGHPARILPERLSATPLLATTSLGDGGLTDGGLIDGGRGDAGWSAVVAWTIATLLHADQTPDDGAGDDALAVRAPALGLEAGWQRRVIEAVGSYGTIYRDTLGEGSPLDLPRGLNAAWDQGGLLCPPAAE